MLMCRFYFNVFYDAALLCMYVRLEVKFWASRWQSRCSAT
jgi:hypothetical protein